MRLPDWESRLHATVDSVLARPFAWWTNDCRSFGTACVVAVTGSDPMEGLISAYSDEAGAQAAIEALGGDDLEDVVAQKLEDIAPAQARRGDLGIVLHKGNKVLVVVLGQAVAAPGPRGLSTLSRLKLTRAFKVG